MAEEVDVCLVCKSKGEPGTFGRTDTDEMLCPVCMSTFGVVRCPQCGIIIISYPRPDNCIKCGADLTEIWGEIDEV